MKRSVKKSEVPGVSTKIETESGHCVIAGAHFAFCVTPDQVRGDEKGNDRFQIQTASPPETPAAGCEADGCLDFARHERVERNEETNGVEGNSDTNGLRGWGQDGKSVG